MVESRFTIFNLDLFKELPQELFTELVNLEDVIPDGILSTLYFHNPAFKKERNDFLDDHESIIQSMYAARHRRRELYDKEDFVTVKTNENAILLKNILSLNH